MKIDILTLFPSMFTNFLSESIIKRALNSNKVMINIHNIRDYSLDPHRKVDDYPFGGGSGMVLMCEPIFRAVEALKSDDSKVILMSPTGQPFHQNTAVTLSQEQHLIIICGHYEGFDERIKTLVDLEISIGDFIVTGGELPSMLIIDAVARLINGVINKESLVHESFNDSLLDYPNYTKPRIFRGLEVPAVLLSGNHQAIKKWRQEERIRITKEKRPDLLKE